VTGTVVALGPVAAGLAWWWAGRALRPIERVRAVAEDIEASDLSRRIGLDRGPTEITSLAASFDAMLDRLEHAADTQRQLIDETSHELRTPLSVLATNAEVLLAHPDPTVDLYRQGLERSQAAATRMRTTIEDLLQDARGRARTIDRQPADLMATVRGVVGDASVLAATRAVSVSVSGPPAATWSFDESTLGRALANLVDNALRHAPDGTDVAIDVEVATSLASITVTDHGPGIAREDFDRIFERFWRGRHEAPGTGLGLAIARQIAWAHGGELTVRSPGPAGNGSVFVLTLRS
jgi:signal transduction histidine kinase